MWCLQHNFLQIILFYNFMQQGCGIPKPYHDPHFKLNRNIIVQLFEWPFEAVARECEQYLGPKGFGGVQVSPINEYRPIKGRPWYERYQPISYKIISRSGNEKKFAEMVHRCNNAGIRIYVDIIPNHMSADGDTTFVTGIGGSLAIPSEREYFAVPYTKDDFNVQCSIQDYNNEQETRNCELVGLHDLDLSKPNPRKQNIDFMNKLIDLGVAGFRIDAATHMWPKDLAAIYTGLKCLNISFGFKPDARPFIYQETSMFKEDYVDLGRIIEFSYGYFVAGGIRNKFPLKNYFNLGQEWGLVADDNAIVFLDNHDTQREDHPLTYKDPLTYKLGMAFMLSYPYGVKRIMSSYAFTNKQTGPPHDSNDNIIDPGPDKNGVCSSYWNCEHRWGSVAEMVEFSNVVDSTPVNEFWGNDDGQAAFCRGDKGFVAFNSGNKDLKSMLKVCVSPGNYCNLATGRLIKSGKNSKCTGKVVTVNKNRETYIEIPKSDPMKFVAFHINAKI